MRFLLLSRQSTNQSSKRLIAAVAERGHVLAGVDPLECVLEVGHRAPGDRGLGLRTQEGPVDGIATLPRFGPGLTEFGLSLLRHFERAGIPGLNDSVSILSARDKFRCLQILSSSGVPVPRTILSRSSNPSDALKGFEGEHVVAKVLQGSQGTGVVRLERGPRGQDWLDRAWAEKQNILVQEYVPGAESDIRLFVVGDRVVASMRREAVDGFRSNLHVGAKSSAYEASSTLEDLAVRATGAVGLDVAGVDVIESTEGPMVLEVNPSPGIEGIEAATGVDVAGAVADALIALAERTEETA